MARGLTGEKKKQAMASFMLEGINVTEEKKEDAITREVTEVTPKKELPKASTRKEAPKKQESANSSASTKKQTTVKNIEESPKKKVGRPARGFESKKMTFALPEDLVNEALIAAQLKHNGNMTAYLIDVINQDLENNKSYYSEFKQLIGNINK